MISLPSFLKNTTCLYLKAVFTALWQEMVLDNIERVRRVQHLNTNSDLAIEMMYEDLPLKPEIPPSDKRDFIRLYPVYVEKMTKRRGIETCQEVYDLNEFHLRELRRTKYKDLYPYHFLRVYLDQEAYEDPDRLSQIREYIRKMAPARCKFHTQILP